MMTPRFPGRPRSLEPAVVLARAGVVSRACKLFSFCTGAGHSSQPVTVVLMNAHLETLGVLCHFSPFAAASSTSTRRAATCCHRSNAPGGLTTPWICLMHVCTVHVSRAALGRTSKGELREGVARKPTTAPTALPASARASQACAAFSRDGHTTGCRSSRRCTTTQ